LNANRSWNYPGFLEQTIQRQSAANFANEYELHQKGYTQIPEAQR
jgi:hypothetical protein